MDRRKSELIRSSERLDGLPVRAIGVLTSTGGDVGFILPRAFLSGECEFDSSIPVSSFLASAFRWQAVLFTNARQPLEHDPISDGSSEVKWRNVPDSIGLA